MNVILPDMLREPDEFMSMLPVRERLPKRKLENGGMLMMLAQLVVLLTLLSWKLENASLVPFSVVNALNGKSDALASLYLSVLASY